MKYKVGDRVRIKSLDWYNENRTKHGDIWFDNAVFVGGQSLYCGCELTIRLVTNDSYYVIENDYYWTDEMIEELVEEEAKPNIIEEAKTYWDSIKDAWICPEGYIFKDENGNVINAMKIVLEKNKYPKTYEECYHITGLSKTSDIYSYKNGLLFNFQKLLIARDAYWKIAGEEMGLGKPWEPDWEDGNLKWCMSYSGNCIEFDQYKSKHHILAFPTEEMRDAFYENFKEEIEICKELL